MTLATMRWHEAVNVRYDQDFRRQSLVRLARRFVQGPRVLDLRCITGSLALDLAEAGMDVTALDAYEGAVARTNELARQRGLAVPMAHLWDFDRLPDWVREQRFDTVACLDVLNHVEDDVAALAQVAEIVRPGGRLIVAAPAFPSLLGRRDRSLGHLRRYTKPGLRALLERHGFTVERLQFWNFIALPLYAAIEGGLRARISDNFRYGWWGALGSLPNRLFSWWYLTVENRVTFPAGLTLLAVAHRAGAAADSTS